MSTTNVLLIAVLGVVGFMVLRPYLSDVAVPSQQSTSTSGTGGRPPVGGSDADFWDNVIGTLNGIFAATNKASQSSARTL